VKISAHILKSPVFIGALVVFIFPFHLKSVGFSNNYDFPNPINKLLFRQKNNRVAAVLAFPFPFGCVGLHRVYLGTDAHVPIVYAATAGGVFGLIPLLDFAILLSHKNISYYENNGNVIMWIKH